MKWKASDYKHPFQHWAPPELVYPCSSTERDVLHAVRETFALPPPYQQMEAEAIENETLVTLDIPIPDGYIAFLENTAEQCTSPQTKHSQAGMQGAKHWLQRVDTPENMFRRLTDGYGISLMFGERCHQYIRNSNNWRGAVGVPLDIDDWRKPVAPGSIEASVEFRLQRKGSPGEIKAMCRADRHQFRKDWIAEIQALMDVKARVATTVLNNYLKPEPCYSQDELFDRYPLIRGICRFLIPSASSLFAGRTFKARGIVLFPEPITDTRIYRAFGDILCSELDCIPPGPTKNPVAVGFGNTHNAHLAYRNPTPDAMWLAEKIQGATATVLSTTKQRQREQKRKAARNAHYTVWGNKTMGEGENISAFIEQCDAVSEMVRSGLLTPGRGIEYRWHESENDRSCDILNGTIHIFSASMQAASPAGENEPVGTHRFYLYHLSGLDMTKTADKPRLREYLFDRGYGSAPKEFAKKQQPQNRAKLHRNTDAGTETPRTQRSDTRRRRKPRDRRMRRRKPCEIRRKKCRS